MKKIFLHRRGLENWPNQWNPPKTLEETGRAFSVSRERVRQIEDEVMTYVLENTILPKRIEKYFLPYRPPVITTKEEIPIGWLRINSRGKNALISHGVRTVKDLNNLDLDELFKSKLPGFGRISLQEAKEALEIISKMKPKNEYKQPLNNQ